MAPNRTGSWNLVASRPPSDGHADVIHINFVLVHGLKDIYDKEWDYGSSLKFWLAKVGNAVPGNNIGFDAYDLQFSMSSLIARSEAEGQAKWPTAFNTQRAKLFDKTIKLQTWESWTAPAQAKKTLFFFIAHGLGVWLVKDMLSEPLGTVIATRTLGLITLDGLISNPERPETASLEPYRAYVKNLCNTFRIRIPSSPAVDNLSDSLRKVDLRFRKLQDFLGSPEGLSSHVHFSQEFQWLHPSVSVWGVSTAEEVGGSGTTKSKPKFRLVRRLFHSGRGRQIPNDKQAYNYIRSGIKTYLTFQANHGSEGPSASNMNVEDAQSSSTVAENTSHNPRTQLEVVKVTPEFAPPEHQLGDYIAGRTGSALVLPKQIAIQLREISRDWERMYKQAGEYLCKGQLESALNLCQEAMKMLQRESVGSGFRDLSRLRIELQTEIITLLRGRYEDLPAATTKLQTLKHAFKEQTPEKDEIGRWLAESFTLRGDHWSAARELREALDSQRQMKGGRKPIPTDRPEDISLVRDIALTFAYLGFFTRAQRVITFLLKSLDNKLGSLRKDLRELKLLQGNAEENVSDKVKVKEAKIFERRELELSSKRDSVVFAAAMIYMLVGNYEQALRLAREAWRGLSSRYSPTNIKALDCSRLIAHLLALTSRNREAEGLCSSTLKTLSSELGPKHPQTLRAMRTLVFLHRTHYRLDQAVATARTLSDITESVMARTHPQAVEARAELASSLRFAGDYKDALHIYLDIVSESQKSYARTFDDHGFVHPDALRYQSELAHLYVDMGQLDQAESLVLDILLEQQHTYRVEFTQAGEGELELTFTKQTKDKYPSQSRQTIVSSLLGMLELEYFLDDVRRILTPDNATGNLPIQYQEDYRRLEDEFAKRLERIGEDIRQYQDLKHRKKMLQVHPSLLHTLEILAEIYFARLDENTEVDLICSMLETIVRWRQKTLGSSHDLTLKSQYQLALAKSQSARPEDRKEARCLFRTVFVQRCSRLGGTHPDTLSAKREFVITCASLEQWENPDRMAILTNPTASNARGSISNRNGTEEHTARVSDQTEEDREMTPEEWEAMELCSHEIIIEQRTKPGPAHPETIKSLLWLFTLQSGLCKISAASKTMKTLLQRLRRTRVQDQRLMSSLLTQERIAGICSDQNQTADALDILSNIVQRCKLDEERELVQLKRGIDGGFSQELTASPEFRSLLDRCRKHIETLQGNREALVRGAFKLYKSFSDGVGSDADASVYLINSFRLARAASEWNLLLDRPVPHSLRREMCQRLEGDVKNHLLGSDTTPFEKRLEAACSLLETIFPKSHVQAVRDETLLLYTPPRTASSNGRTNGVTDHEPENATQSGDATQETASEILSKDVPPETISPAQLEKMMEGFKQFILDQMGCNYSESDEFVGDHLSESSGGGEEYGGDYL